MNTKNSFKDLFNKIFIQVPENRYEFTLPDNTDSNIDNNNINSSYDNSKDDDKNKNINTDTDANINININTNKNNNSTTTPPKNIFPSIDVNLEYLKTRYNALINSDIVIREFNLLAKNKQYRAFIIFIDGMVDTNLINDYVLKPLMLRNVANTYINNDQDRVISEAKTNNITVRKIKKFNITDYIFSCLLPENNVKETNTFDEIITAINSGCCGLFIDTLNTSFNVDVKGFQARTITTPQNETVIKGPQEAFVENIRTNTSILRRIINNENLIIQNVEIGNITKTKCALCYIKDIANSDLVSEVEFRLNNLEIDSLLSSGELEQLIVDSNDLAAPRVISTERPDTVSRYLLEGRVAIIVNGTPFVLVAPATIVDFMSTPEDMNLKPIFSNFLRLIRFLGSIIILLLPGVYVAITSFHQEIFPTELLFSILAARENVPLPILLEIVIMEISFELIREAGLRLPSAIGFTVSIVGALVIGESAVEANLVSPPLVIIVAITAIASSSIPDFSFGFHLRLFRFLFIILGFMAGFLGISLGLFVYICMLTNVKSFGLNTTTPFAPYINTKSNKYFISPVWQREYRPAYLDPKKIKSQEEISMKWKQ